MERESELQRELRRTKESLVSVALRLQVAIKVSEEDGHTISSLQQELADARRDAIVSNKQAALAAEMIAQLNLEISTLKRKLRSIEAVRSYKYLNICQNFKLGKDCLITKSKHS